VSDRLILPRSREFVQSIPQKPLGWLAQEAGVSRILAGRGRRKRQALKFAKRVIHAADKMQQQPDDAVKQQLQESAAKVRKLGANPSGKQVIHCFAAIREIVRRISGMEAYHTQLAAAYGLFRGGAVEMATGEGKTLSAVIAASAHGVLGHVVHVISANDYLAERDGNELAEVYQALGLSVGIILPDMERDERRAVYRSDIVYAANKEVAFDYLRDRIASGLRSVAGDADIMIKAKRVLGSSANDQPVLRALDVAIVDEVDSVLIDDAGTPLLISTERGASDSQIPAQALEVAAQLTENRDWRINRLAGMITLTDKGLEKIQQLGEKFGGPWKQRVRREEMVSQALSAVHLFKRDEHYIVRDDKVMIIDQNTGRRMEDRFWGQGLHQMIELKEGLEGSGEKRPLISTTYQRFFRRYRTLSGTSGTIDECARELAKVYNLRPLAIPLRKASRRKMHPPRVYKDADRVRAALVESAKKCITNGQAVLIGTRTIQDAEAISNALTDKGIDHQLLSAAQDADENALVAKAGQAGMVTVATNMAGRGTDIRLGAKVAEKGGLVVLLYQQHFSKRVDRQLIGRCARQQDPGEAMIFVSPDDALLAVLAGKKGWLARRCAGWSLLTPRILRWAQKMNEQENALRRHRLVEADRRMAELLAFSGGLE
jgi:preprotein translocase subunit SecA